MIGKRNNVGKAGRLFTLVIGVMIVFATASPLSAKTPKLTFGAEIRFRSESLDNFNLAFYGSNPSRGKAHDQFLLGRFRAGFDYIPNQVIHLALWGQDAREWGYGFKDKDFYNSVFGTEHNPFKDEFELWDTYLEIKKPFDWPLAVKAGRQRIFYGDKRVFGPGQWGNSGKWIWDAVKMSFFIPKGFVDVYYGRTMIHQPTEFSLNHRHGYESFGTYSHFALPPQWFDVAIEPFFMTRTDDHNNYVGEDGITGDLDAWYAGLRIYRMNIKNFDLDFTYIREFGDYSGDKLGAYGYHVLVGYRFPNAAVNPRLSVEYSAASGDSDPSDGRHETFDGAFGARDKMYGRMNLFHWKNLKDAQVNLEVRLRKRVFLKTEFHDFRLAEKKDAWYLNPREYRDRSGESGEKVGREIDMIAHFTIYGKNEIQVGYGHFWPGEFARKIASDKQADWVFLQWRCRFFRDLVPIHE